MTAYDASNAIIPSHLHQHQNTEEADFLSRVPLFASLKEAPLTELAGRLRTRSYRAGEVIFHQDDPGTILHVIKSGRVKITTTSPEGRTSNQMG